MARIQLILTLMVVAGGSLVASDQGAGSGKKALPRTSPGNTGKQGGGQQALVNEESLCASFTEPGNAGVIAFTLKERLFVIGSYYASSPEDASRVTKRFLAALPKLIAQCDTSIWDQEIELSWEGSVQKGTFGSCLNAMIQKCQPTHNPLNKAQELFVGMAKILMEHSLALEKANKQSVRPQDAKKSTSTSSSGRPTWNRLQALELADDERLCALLPIEHHCAAVELFDRFIICFAEEKDEKKLKANAKKLLTALPELIKRCDGPIADVWFRVPQLLWFTGGCQENSFEGYVKLIATKAEEMKPQLEELCATLRAQRNRFLTSRKLTINSYPYAYDPGNGIIKPACERWSVPNACWVTMVKPFHDPTDAQYDAQDLQRNLFETVCAHITDANEDFLYFLSDLESHINTPSALTHYTADTWAKISEGEYAGLRTEATRRLAVSEYDSRKRKIETILANRATRGMAILKSQRARAVEDPYGEPLVVKSKRRNSMERTEQSSGWFGGWVGSSTSTGPKIEEVDGDDATNSDVIMIEGGAPSVADLLALPAPTQEEDEEWLAELLRSANNGVLQLGWKK